MTTPINPELMLKAAQMARPGLKWIDFGGWIACDGAYDAGPEFNPITSEADAFALERSLKIAGWEFSCAFPDFVDECSFIAHMNALFSPAFRHQLVDKSDTLLLLKCVAAMHSLNLYLTAEKV